MAKVAGSRGTVDLALTARMRPVASLRRTTRIADDAAAGREIVGREHVAGGRLRVAANAGADEVLAAAFELVAAVARRRREVCQAAGNLLVVALFGVGRVEVRRVVVE